MGAKEFLKLSVIVLAAGAALLAPCPAFARADGAASWKPALRKRLEALEPEFPGRFGVFVRVIQPGAEAEELSYRGDESWYFASGVKLPVAIEVFRQAERGMLSLSETIPLREEDKIDGAGGTNGLRAGSLPDVRYLLEQMLVHSDNTASDLLIRRVGLERVNEGISRLVPGNFGPITTLADVRRRAYAGVHPSALALSNPELRRLKAATGESGKLKALGSLLGISPERFLTRRLDQAYAGYYASGLNSGTLRAYAALLETLDGGHALTGPSRAALLGIMARAETGKKRVRAGIPSRIAFAHKTGTQRGRVCDFGIAWDRSEPTSRRVIIAACTRDLRPLTHDQERAEAVLRRIGSALARAGVFRLQDPDRDPSRDRPVLAASRSRGARRF